MDPFNAPSSVLEACNSNVYNLNWPKTILFTLLSIVATYISSIYLTGILTEIILIPISKPAIETIMLVDAILTFSLLLLLFSGLSLVQRVHTNIVILSGAIFMFIFWGIESDAFFNGLNPFFPARFEINMAINDIVAAIIVLFINNRSTR